MEASVEPHGLNTASLHFARNTGGPRSLVHPLRATRAQVGWSNLICAHSPALVSTFERFAPCSPLDLYGDYSRREDMAQLQLPRVQSGRRVGSA